VYVPHELRSAGTKRGRFSVPGGYRRSIHSYGYTQLFRSGIVEYADGFLLQLATNWWASDDLRQELEKHDGQLAIQTQSIRFRIDGPQRAIVRWFFANRNYGKSVFVTTMQSAFPQTAVSHRDIFTSLKCSVGH